MTKLSKIRHIKDREQTNDIFDTPYPVAMKLIKMTDIKETDRVLDPCSGKGIFYNNLPDCNKMYCELTENKNFFEFNELVDVVIGNPPFSQWKKWIEHTVQLNPRIISYIMGCLNLTPKRMEYLKQKGYNLKSMEIVTIEGWFGNTFLVVFEKHVTPIITFEPVTYKKPVY
jgi:hypothetical protein